MKQHFNKLLNENKNQLKMHIQKLVNDDDAAY